MKYGVVEFDDAVMHGKPVFHNTNVTIQTMFEYLEDGKSLAKFLDDYPGVNRTDAVEVLQMAKRVITSERVFKENFSA
jgi:uncharacterized protein (DUF433 family)